VEEMVSVEQNLQVELKKVLFAMETKRTDFDNILQDVNKVKKYANDLQHSAARVAMNRAVEFVLIAMFGASVLNR
jgi:hypothetical protein